MSSAPVEPHTQDLRAELRERLAGRVVDSPRGLNRFETDFGALGRKRPAVVIKASSGSEIRTALRIARRHGTAVQVRGAGCSVNGQATSGGGMLLVVARDVMATPRECEAGCYEIDAGNRWGAVESWLNDRGRCIPVLADNLRLSVGGTLAVGGFGMDSIRFGSQVSHVRQLKLITPDGESRWCSPQDRPDLFRFSLAGHGRLGVIEKAVIATQPHHRYTVLFSRRHSNLVDLAEGMAGLADAAASGPQVFKAFQARGKTIEVTGLYAGSLAQARALAAPDVGGRRRWARRIVPWHRFLRSHSVALWVGHYGRRKRVWSDFLVDHAGLVELAGLIERLKAMGGFGTALKSVYVLANRVAAPGTGLPFDPGNVGRGPMSFGVGVYCMVPSGDQDTLDRVRQTMRHCLDLALAVGGRPYLYGWHELEESERQTLWGDEWERLRRLRSELDPDGLFQRDKALTPRQADELLGG